MRRPTDAKAYRCDTVDAILSMRYRRSIIVTTQAVRLIRRAWLQASILHYGVYIIVAPPSYPCIAVSLYPAGLRHIHRLQFLCGVIFCPPSLIISIYPDSYQPSRTHALFACIAWVAWVLTPSCQFWTRRLLGFCPGRLIDCPVKLPPSPPLLPFPHNMSADQSTDPS